MRSVSLMRSSEASRTVMPPVAAPSTASAGISSISAAVNGPSIEPRCKPEARTRRSPISSPAGCRTSSTLIGRADSRQKIEQRRARRVQPHSLDHQIGVLHQQRGDQEKARRGEIAGNEQLAALEPRARP